MVIFDRINEKEDVSLRPDSTNEKTATLSQSHSHLYGNSTDSTESALPRVSLNSYSTSTASVETSANRRRSFYQRWIDSFKPINLEDDGVDTSRLTPLEKSILASAKHPLARKLKTRHLNMIAIGGSIGTGLFVSSGYALARGGPAAVLIGYIIVGYAVLTMVYSLGELSVQFPVSGSFNAFFTRFIDPSWGFTLAIMYYLSWAISYPSELIACAMTIQFWTTSINPAVYVAIVWVVILVVNFFGVRGYGEVEFVLSIIKVLAVVGFIILGICITCGVGDQGYIGGKYWHDPGAFNHGFKGVCSVFISSAFSFGGVELVALTAAETLQPKISLRRATKQVFWRVTIFYLLTSIVIGCLVPYTNNDLLNGEGIAASPFVIAVNQGGIKVIPHIMNAVIVAAVISVGNSSVYGSSRTLASLAAQGLLPGIFGYIDKEGRPLVAILLSSLLGLLGFLVVNKNEDAVFTWFFSVCSLASFFIWLMVNVTHLRFRYALRRQSRSTNEIIFKSPLGTWGSWTGLFLLLFIICVLIWVSAYPIDVHGSDVVSFWQSCLSLPLLILIWVLHKTYYKTWNQLWIKLEDIDLDTGRREADLDRLKQEIAEEKEKFRAKPFYYKVYHFFC
ncbi:SAM3 [Candida oxycetoniae]|uniref:SAM3 n=1 Tax=Candida oxycetoniae TaxID=497107 RepID=A0AAI9SZH7_9ASCO|nr:SAM3 [Candida oxycetoniae]KAI3405824.2 SAM3 [Candida oxycetoniae]